jgi:hypothetical protein
LKITIESQVANDPAALFTVTLNGKLLGEHMTAAQAQVLASEIIERFVLGERPAVRSKAGKP